MRNKIINREIKKIENRVKEMSQEDIHEVAQEIIDRDPLYRELGITVSDFDINKVEELTIRVRAKLGFKIGVERFGLIDNMSRTLEGQRKLYLMSGEMQWLNEFVQNYERYHVFYTSAKLKGVKIK